MTCTIVPPVDRFSSSAIAFLDCQAQTLGSQGYHALAAPGSSVSLLLTAMLTIFVALVGYRMLFGETTTLRENVLTFVRIGVVLGFATSWPAYQAVIYDVVLRGPGNLVAEIGAPAELPGATGGLPSRLDAVDHAFRTLAIYGVGPAGLDPSAQTRPSDIAPPMFAGFDTFALGASRVIFLATAIGAFALVRLSAGLLLALGPLFIGFLLFEATRGLFEGWARALIGLALAALATAILLGVELVLLEPWLGELIRQRAGGAAIAGTPTPLLATTTVFAVVMAAVLALVGRIGFSLRLPSGLSPPYSRFGHRSETAGVNIGVSSHSISGSGQGRSRALAIADSISAVQRREEQIMQNGSQAGASAGGNSAGVRGGATRTSIPNTPLGQSARRRTATRISASAGMRDRRL